MAQTTPGGRSGGTMRDFKKESERLARRKKARAVRRVAIPAGQVALLLAYVSGLVGTSLAALEDLVDSVRIAFTPSAGYPVQTGIAELYQLEEMNGGFVELGAEGCVVYSANGARLRSMQPGYARPAVTAGKHRFALYNRSGNQLRVESRTQSLYTEQYENNILLCEMAPGGTLAVATGHSRYVAELLVYSPLMEQLLSWDMVESEGVPMRLAFSADDRRLAVAAVSAQNGRLLTHIYLLNTRKAGETLLVTQQDSLVLDLVWRSGNELLVVYDDHAAVYSTVDGEEKLRFDYGGDAVAGWSAEGKRLALLFDGGSGSRLTVLDENLAPTADLAVSEANSVTLTRTAVYLAEDNCVVCFSLAGEYQWAKPGTADVLAVLDAAELLVFESNTAAVLQPPEE